MTQLTPHFTWEELTASDTARQLGIANTPTAGHRANLLTLALGLEWARSIVRVPFRMHSAYRCPALNKAVGGVPNSDHALGFAGDVEPLGMPALQAAWKLASSDLVFDQLIHEVSRGIIHLSFAPRMRRQVLTQEGGPGTPVTPGLRKPT